MRTPLLLGVVGALLVGLVAAPAASAAKVPCVVGQKAPKCKVWTAKVKFAADGDTFRPKIKQGKKWSKAKATVRMTGIQAPELSSYSRVGKGRRGNCMGVEAANELDKLIKRRKIRLVAMKGGSTTEGGRARLRRTVQVKRGGRWIDPAMVLLQKGLALWFPNGSDEWAWNGVYARLAEQAAARGVGLWNPEACGRVGPSPDAQFRMKVKWDGEGTDSAKNANAEWVRIYNDGPTPAPLSGWTLRDSHLRGNKMQSGYRFPSNAVVPAGGSITVHVGHGSNGGGKFFWGLSEIIFDNATADKKQIGDGAYLFDPHSELRAHLQYPCRTTCSEALDGNVGLTAKYDGLDYEWVTVTNRSSQWVSLDGYEIENQPYFHEFGPRDVLAPGKAVTIWINEESRIPLDRPGLGKVMVPPIAGVLPFQSTSFFRNWALPSVGILSDSGDVVTLRNPAGAPVAGACQSWGRFSCPKV